MTTGTNKTDNGQGKQQPTHRAYYVRERGEGKKAEWNPIGAAFAAAPQTSGT